MLSIRRPCLRGTLWLATLLTTIGAQTHPVTIFDDTFTEGERQTQGLPNSAAWYQNATVANNLAVRNGALTATVANSSRTLWTHFPTVNLKIGESIAVTLDFRTTAAVTTGFRIGLCYTSDAGPTPADGAGPTGAYQGYGLENFFAIKRNGPAAGNSDAQIINQLGFGETAVPVWNRIDPNNRGVRGAPLQANTPYSLTLRIARTGADTATVSTALTGAGLDGTNSTSVTDSSGIFATFDTFVIGIVGNALAGDLIITRAFLVGEITTSTAGHLVNMSIRTNAGTGDNTLIVGVGIGGAGTTGAKPALFRAVGPTLAAFGVNGTLADPVITAFQGSNQVAQNDNWAGGFDFSTVGAFALSGPAPRDAALYNVSVPIGSYSLQITGRNNGTGIALAEIYDATPAAMFTSTTPRLVNVSARTGVGTGDGVLIAGFVIGGNNDARVLIRAVGPTLGGFGVSGTLVDPQLDIFRGTTRVAGNDNWISTDAATFSSVGAFPLNAGSRDAALVTSLAPGSYTAQVSGVNNTTGVALVEIYELP